MKEIRFDDIEALQAEISDEWSDWTKEIEVTQEMINGFAELTGDRQWIHVDVERANRESPFGGPIAHGFLTLSLLPQMNPSPVKIVGHKNGVNYGAESLRFLAPVPAGSKVHGRARITAVTQRPTGTLVTTQIAVHVVGNDERPALIYNMQVLNQG